MGRKRRSRGKTRGGEGQNATDRVYALLKNRIQNNVLAVGRTYLQDEIALRFSVSRTPAREAIIRLASENFVQIRRRKGILVKPITSPDIAQMCETLAVLEALATRRIAAQGASPHLMRRLEKQHDAMTAAVAKRDMRSWIRADERFHKELVAGAGNDELARVTGTLWDRLKRVRRKTARLREPPAQSNRDHENLLAAIRRRNPERAFELQERHHARFVKLIEGLLDEHGIEEI